MKLLYLLVFLSNCGLILCIELNFMNLFLSNFVQND